MVDLRGENDNWLHRDEEEVPDLRFSRRHSHGELLENARAEIRPKLARKIRIKYPRTFQVKMGSTESVARKFLKATSDEALETAVERAARDLSDKPEEISIIPEDLTSRAAKLLIERDVDSEGVPNIEDFLSFR